MWDVLIGRYADWANVFSPDGSANVETDWRQGGRIAFRDGTGSGIGGVITEHVPNERITVTYDVEYGPDGSESREGGMIGGVEGYEVADHDGATRLSIRSDMAEEYLDMMSEAWDKALATIKRLAEQA